MFARQKAVYMKQKRLEAVDLGIDSGEWMHRVPKPRLATVRAAMRKEQWAKRPARQNSKLDLAFACATTGSRGGVLSVQHEPTGLNFRVHLFLERKTITSHEPQLESLSSKRPYGS